MKEKELEKARHQLVVKSNRLIRSPQFTLNITEQRIMLYIISKIKPEDKEFTEYQFSILDFIQVCGIKGNAYYSYIKEAIKKLADKSIWIKTNPKEEVLCRWIEKARINYGTGIITVRIDEDLRPLLLELKSSFTTYELIAILALKNKYSLRMYELLKSYQFIGHYKTTLTQLRDTLMCKDEYERTVDFRRNVIDKAIAEINRFTDLEISYELIKEWREIVGINFIIKESEDFTGDYDATRLYLKGVIPSNSVMERELAEMLENQQMTLFEEDLIEDIE